MTDAARLGVVPRELLEGLAAEAPTPEPSPTPPAGGNGAYTSRLVVPRWLSDQGVAFRVKAEPDGKGRTVYVLKECPFDPSHGDPDACVMQDGKGKMSAQCFHNSCRGRGWQHFKQALGSPRPDHYDPPLPGRHQRRRTAADRPSANETASATGDAGEDPAGGPAGEGPSDRGDLPWIQGNQRQLRDATDEALAALLARNDPPTVFQRGGLLTRLRVRADDGAPLLEPLADAALRGVLARVANWKKFRNTRNGVVEEEDAPPMEVVKDLANLPAWDGIAVIEAVVECPVFARTGERIDTPGFHPEARLWYQPAPGLVVPAVAPRPSPAEVDRARHLLLVELLGDFPFRDDASKAHALAALLLPFVRPLIDGPTPLHLLDAPVEGTGKTLLATVIALVATGREAEAIAEGDGDEEWRKRLTAVLAEGARFVLLDNLSRALDSGALAAALTARTWKDRILGHSKMAALPNTAVWLASGNNTCLSRELIRRTLWCRLDAKVDAPWERRGFRHPNLIGWAKAQRGHLVGAALTLCQAWVAAGRPVGKQTLGMFESWAEVVGGVLDVAGVPGLLANAKEFRAARADKVGEWRAFVAAWWERHGADKVGVAALFALAAEQKLLDSVLGDKGEKSQRIRLGKALAQMSDRVVAGFRLESAGQDFKARQQYCLQPAGTGETAAAGPPPADDGLCEWSA
jgi:hypothetical protein